jgi:hypothetical protein
MFYSESLGENVLKLFLRNLQMGQLSLSLASSSILTYVVFASKAVAYPSRIQVLPYRVGKACGDKHSSLLGPFISH